MLKKQSPQVPFTDAKTTCQDFDTGIVFIKCALSNQG